MIKKILAWPIGLIAIPLFVLYLAIRYNKYERNDIIDDLEWLIQKNTH